MYCNQSCLWVCVCVCLWVCYHDNSELCASILTKLGLYVKIVTISSWLNFGHPASPGRGSATGQNFWLRLTTASAQCFRLPECFFHLRWYVFYLLIVLVKLSVPARWLARKTPLRKPNRGEGTISTKPGLKSVYGFLGLVYCFIVLWCVYLVPWPNQQTTNSLVQRLWRAYQSRTSREYGRTLSRAGLCAVQRRDRSTGKEATGAIRYQLIVNLS